MNIKYIPLLLVILMTGLTRGVFAESCEVKGEEAGFIRLLCKGQNYFAMPAEVFQKMIAENQSNKKLISDFKSQLQQTQKLVQDHQALTNRYSELSLQYEQLNTKFEATLDQSIAIADSYKNSASDLVSLSENYNELVRNYDDLTEKYRNIALNAGSSISFDLGVGLTDNNGESHAVGLIGMGISSYHIWGLFQSDNTGLIFGKTFDF